MRMTIEAQRPIGHWGCLKRGYFRFEEERDDDIPAGRQHLLCRPLADRGADRAEGASLENWRLFAACSSHTRNGPMPARSQIGAQPIEKVKKTLTRAPPNRLSITHPRPTFRLVRP